MSQRARCQHNSLDCVSGYVSVRIKLVIAFVCFFATFLLWAPWIGARHREDASHHFRRLQIPDDWDVVVVGGGKVSRWYLGTITDNPIGFVICTLILVACAIWTHRLYRQVRRPQYCPNCKSLVPARSLEPYTAVSPKRCPHCGKDRAVRFGGGHTAEKR